MQLETWSERVVLAPVTVICVIILSTLFDKLRKVLPFRVNCWFCNTNTWVRLPERNCWTCPSCEQYNGFTKDGDYNRPLTPAPSPPCKPRSASVHPIDNGLCRMCNVNQQLKVAQLANFVPVSEASFDREIITYKSQLEKAYKLCGPCRKVVKAKLRKEKETLIGSKLLENRSPKKVNRHDKHKKFAKKTIRYIAMSVTLALAILITRDCYNYLIKLQKFNSALLKCGQVVESVMGKIKAVILIKLFEVFPSLQQYEERYDHFQELYIEIIQKLANINVATDWRYVQRVLGGVGCIFQILCHLLSLNVTRYETATEALWAVLLGTMISLTLPVPVNLAIKLISAIALFAMYKIANASSNKPKFTNPVSSSKRLKNLARRDSHARSKGDSDSELDTDDDVSLSHYGIDNSTFSSDSNSQANFSFASGRGNSSFLKKPMSVWSAPSVNSTFNCSSPFPNGSISHASFNSQNTVKPAFNIYQKLSHLDSDSDLDEGINGLHLGTSPKKNHAINNTFSIQQFDNVSQNFTAPMSLHQRPLISPSKLGQSTSWVAGGYWGDERSVFEAAASRSSSQSSGFESHASSLQKNVFSRPPSREESICSELDRTICTDFSQPYGVVRNSFSYNHAGLRSPVHPKLNCDSHLQIPVPFIQKSYNPFSDCQSVRSRSGYPPYRTSGLIKLPHLDT